MLPYNVIILRNSNFSCKRNHFSFSAFPIIVKPKIDPSQTETISGNLNDQATKEFDYYSNADITNVRCYKSVNGTRQNSNVCTTFHKDTMIELPVFSHVVTTAGVKLTISIPIDSEDDFGLYDVVVKNEIGSVVLKLKIIPQGTEHNKTEQSYRHGNYFYTKTFLYTFNISNTK